MREYHDLYLKTDVLQLADVFETFRDVCITYYELDPAWYYTTPGLAWAALLKKSGVKLDLLSDPNKHLMIEKGKRGGLSVIIKRHAMANNKYMIEGYDENKESVFLKYLDANILYGWPMIQGIPTSDFRWVPEKEFKNWRNYPCILEVDLEYPKELHKLHNEYPCAPEKLKLGAVQKLCATLYDKEKYVIHHHILKLYLSLGLKLKKKYIKLLDLKKKIGWRIILILIQKKDQKPITVLKRISLN